jgi:preprotein translocase subunit YajC
MGAPPQGGSAWLQFVPFALVWRIFYFIILLPMKRKQQKIQEFLDSLKVGDRVITTGGIYGRSHASAIRACSSRSQTRFASRWRRRAIGGYQGQAPSSSQRKRPSQGSGLRPTSTGFE